MPQGCRDPCGMHRGGSRRGAENLCTPNEEVIVHPALTGTFSILGAEHATTRAENTCMFGINIVEYACSAIYLSNILFDT